MVSFKLDKFFGPSGSFSGLVLFIVGLGTIYFSYVSIAICVFGAFFAFSFTGTQINMEKKEYRFYNAIFGFIKVGKWISIEDYNQLKVAHLKKEYTAYSLSNRRLDTTKVDYRIFLTKKQDTREKLILCKCKTLAQAIEETERLAQLLEIPVPDNLA